MSRVRKQKSIADFLYELECSLKDQLDIFENEINVIRLKRLPFLLEQRRQEQLKGAIRNGDFPAALLLLGSVDSSDPCARPFAAEFIEAVKREAEKSAEAGR